MVCREGRMKKMICDEGEGVEEFGIWIWVYEFPT